MLRRVRLCRGQPLISLSLSTSLSIWGPAVYRPLSLSRFERADSVTAGEGEDRNVADCLDLFVGCSAREEKKIITEHK